MESPGELEALRARLERAGFIAAEEEAAELMACSAGNPGLRETLVQRRLGGEPLAWITGFVVFCGQEIRIAPGVYVPRWHSELLARRAAERLPDSGLAIDLCTGSGAIARVLMARRPQARVVASDIDRRAVRCGESNGVEAYAGDLFAPLPRDLGHQADVIVAVAPYVPANERSLLQRDTFEFETARSYDGGPDGTDVLRRIVAGSRDFLKPGGALLLELGGDQAELLADDLARLGYGDVGSLVDREGGVRGIEATRCSRRRRSASSCTRSRAR